MNNQSEVLSIIKVKNLIKKKIVRNQHRIDSFMTNEAIKINVNNHIYKRTKNHKLSDNEKKNIKKIREETNKIIKKNNLSFDQKKYKIRQMFNTYKIYSNIRFYNNFLKNKNEYLKRTTKSSINYQNNNMKNNNNYKNPFEDFIELNNNNIDEYFSIYKFHGIKKNNSNNNNHKEIYEYLIDYLVNCGDSYNSLIYYDKKIIEFLKISLILLNFDNEEVVYNINKEPNARGGWATIYIDGDKIKKFESLRFQNNKSEKSTTRPKYKVYNYVIGQIFITMIIHNFLYKINDEYVPRLDSVSFNYKLDLSRTIMENAFSDSSYENYVFEDYIINKKEDLNYVNNILFFLHKISEILKFYQEKCYFVHCDLHTGNILISFKYNINNNKEIDFNSVKIKLIDFQMSSIIFKMDGIPKILKDINLKEHRRTNYIDPRVSNIWNKIDLITLLVKIFILPYYNSKNIQLPELESHNNYKSLIKKISKIFNYSTFWIKNPYKERFETVKRQLKTERDVLPFFAIIKEKKFRTSFFSYKESRNITKKYIPEFFLEEIKKLINIK